jgi:hypothetical protein
MIISIIVVILILYIFITIRSYINFNRSLRKLWSENVFWTRQYIVESAAESPKKSYVADKLINIQHQINIALQIEESKCETNEAGKLFVKNMGLTLNLIDSIIKNNKNEQKSITLEINKNIMRISELLKNKFPSYWEDISEKLISYVKLTAEETNMYVNNRREGKINLYNFDAAYIDILNIADLLSKSYIINKK